MWNTRPDWRIMATASRWPLSRVGEDDGSCHDPALLDDWHVIGFGRDVAPGGSVVFRRIMSPIWESVPAIVVPMPVVMMYDGTAKPFADIIAVVSPIGAGKTVRHKSLWRVGVE